MERLTFDNFPRSGTAFLSLALQEGFPSYEVVWGGHWIENIRTVNRLITVVRHPKDCVPSWVEFSETHHSLEEILDWYGRFMEATYLRRDEVSIASFENLTRNPNGVLRDFAERFDLRDHVEVNVDLLRDRLRQEFPSNSPRDFTPERKRLNNEVAKCSNYGECVASYERVLSSI